MEEMDIDQVAELLGRTELFHTLDERARREVAGTVTQVAYVKGQTIFVQDEPGDRMFVLAEGAIKLVVRSRHGEVVELARHRPPAVFGEMALLDGGSLERRGLIRVSEGKIEILELEGLKRRADL
jgi:CRP-like cAMP-binding protein